ncbi:MAG: HDOD domain-containing protein [Acidobacteria bacterium]|jgi:HD-like signal output (HDOD) protein|nr:HDOD domain-containing protein [Acidobacteriota bacterium]
MPDADAPIVDFAWLDGDHSLAVPMLPAVAHRVIELTSDPDVPLPTLSNLVAKDQVLAARVLGLANSAYSAPMQPITTVTEAVVRLGIAAVRNVVVTVCFASRMHDPAIYGSLGRDLVDHAIGTAYVARLLAEHARTNRDEAFLFGLVHDIGKLIILKLAHDHQKQHRTSIAPAIIDLAVVERHAAMGALALRRWKLPESLDEPIMYHHDFQSAPLRRKEAAVCYAANLLAHRYGFGCSRSDVEILGDPVAAELQLDEAWLAEIDARAPGLVNVAKQFLN